MASVSRGQRRAGSHKTPDILDYIHLALRKPSRKIVTNSEEEAGMPREATAEWQEVPANKGTLKPREQLSPSRTKGPMLPHYYLP